MKHADCNKEDEEYLLCTQANHMVRSDLQKKTMEELEELMND
jgi:hypothetical protein